MEHNLAQDLANADWIVTKVKATKQYAQNLYAALCNTDWQRIDVLPILKDQKWHCSWRSAGGIIAKLRSEGDYMDWYCTGIRDVDYDEEICREWDKRRYVPEGCVTNEIRTDLELLGWRCVWEDGKEEWDKYLD